MTYYEAASGARVFSAGAFTLAGAVWQPPVSQMMINLIEGLSQPGDGTPGRGWSLAPTVTRGAFSMLRPIAVLLAALAPDRLRGRRCPTLPAPVKADLSGDYWRAGCPVPLAKLRLLTVKHWGFDGKAHSGAARRPPIRRGRARDGLREALHAEVPDPAPLALGFLRLAAAGRATSAARSTAVRRRRRPALGRRARGAGRTTPTGLAVDINPNENPYVGCGMTRNKARLPYLDRSRVRPGMVTPAVVKAFAEIGMGMGRVVERQDQGYVRFSHNGH